MDTDDALITGLTTDLDGTFEAVVLAHQDRLYSIALRMLGNPADAEEAAQDALVRAYRALAGYDRERILGLRFRSWLATILLNLCRSDGADGRRRPRFPRRLPRQAGTVGRRATGRSRGWSVGASAEAGRTV